MNKCIIIGNLVRDPVLRTTQNGNAVCNFTVAVNERRGDGENAASYFDISAWERLGEICDQYLMKGKKVMVCGRVSARGYLSRSGEARASLSISAEEVEFLSPAGNAGEFEEVPVDETPFGG